MPTDADYYLHARILAHLGKDLMLEMILEMIWAYEQHQTKDNASNGGPKDLVSFSSWLAKYFQKLCDKAPGDIEYYKQQVMQAARDRNFSGLISQEASSSVERQSDTSEASIHLGSPLQPLRGQKPLHRVDPTQAQFPPTPPQIRWGTNSEFGSSSETIVFTDLDGRDHPFPVQYIGRFIRGQPFNVISAEALKTFPHCEPSPCDFTFSQHDAPTPYHFFAASFCVYLPWYRPQWRESGDYTLEEKYKFYIVDSPMPCPVLLKDHIPRRIRVPSENATSGGMSPGWGHPAYSLHEDMPSHRFYGQGIPDHQHARPGYGLHQEYPQKSPHSRLYNMPASRTQGFPPATNLGSQAFASGNGPIANAEMPPPPPQSHTQMGQAAQPNTAASLQTQVRNEPDSKPPGAGLDTRTDVPEAPSNNPSTNAQTHQKDLGGGGGSSKRVDVKWWLDKQNADEDVDFSNFQARMCEIFQDHFEIDLRSDSCRLVFSIPNSEETKSFAFRKNKSEEVCSKVLNWMENSNEPLFKCIITKLP